jgi:GrpB-like predicted nucleotidyltransferase (UPF0157 family)
MRRGLTSAGQRTRHNGNFVKSGGRAAEAQRWTAICNHNETSPPVDMSTLRSKPVVLVPYDPAWPLAFMALSDVYVAKLGELVHVVEHVGSTSVPGLVAKPIIDIDIVMSSETAFSTIVERLSLLGYRHNGDQGVPGRNAFSRDGAADVPRDGTGRQWPLHNLYVLSVDSTELQRHLLFRGWLRSGSDKAARYGALKQHLAEIYREDRDLYCEAKTDFIEAALRESINLDAPNQR